MKVPERMPLEQIYDEFKGSNLLDGNDYFDGHIGVIVGLRGFFAPFLEKRLPFLIEEYRIGIVREGAARSIINLKEKELRKGMMLFVTPGTIVEPTWASEDFELDGMGVPVETFVLAHGRYVPELFNGQMRDGQLSVSEGELALAGETFRMLLGITRGMSERSGVARGMVAVITRYYSEIYERYGAVMSGSGGMSLFDRYLRLVNEHYREEHQLGYYAGRLCVTERYLGTEVRRQSGVGAKEWIDRALVSAAKVMLRHDGASVSEVSERLNFANVSFFCKYFKRVAGCTPNDWRRL